VTHIALPETWRYKGVDLSTYATLVRSTDGVDELPPIRGENITVPAIVGRRFARKGHDQKRLSLALWVNSLDAAGAPGTTNPRQTRINLDALQSIFGQRTTGSLVRVMPDGTERTGQAEVVSTSNIQDTLGGDAIGMVVDFLLPDPYLYGSAVAPSQAIAASPTNWSHTNAGTVATHRLVLTFTGPISNPRLSNLTIDAGLGFYVECLVTVDSGKLLVIDCGAFTALNDGVNAIGSVRHSGAFEFFRLVPGSNSLRVTATTPGGSLAIGYAPAYL
jgi:hypothetical protein